MSEPQNRLVQLAELYKRLEAQHEEQKGILDAIGEEWTSTENELMELMVEEGVNQIRLPGVGLFSFGSRSYLSVTKDNKDTYFKYLLETKNDGILKLHVDDKTNGVFLDSHLQDLIKENMNVKGLDEVSARDAALEFLKTKGVSYFTKRRLSVRKA